MFKFKVADIVMEFECHHEEFFRHRLKDYIVENEKADMYLKYAVDENIQLPPHEITGKVQDANLGVRTDNGNSIVYLPNPKSGRIISYTENNADYSYNVSKIVHIEPSERSTLTDCDREYLRSGGIFNNRLIYEGGTTLHGSCIAYRGGGVIFSAPCGTGKSTHTGIWKKVFGDDVVFVNDDKPAIRFRDNVPYVYGAPWSGKTELNTNISVPLKGIVFIGRSEENTIKKIGVAETVCYLNDQTFPSFHDRALFEKNMDVIERLIETVPVYKLDCNMDDSAAILVRDTIFKGE